ncbi:checkpoint serine/threonine-protein kinase Bub1p [[Candida] railenensis]|uniref:Checkpoint serine/threonine-protein kinase Bub1p n=1 Tax=[Candida] railenensis TaxID=45579 RepID=A0A9P0W123_9ASCO|nr:checkpoint serine/threonine-protein kinase Bub1p [[Candida] railenensis]
MVDASVLELHKENIQPLVGGRPASKLSEALQQTSPAKLYSSNREKFESQLENLDELDDPLQVYCDYVEWTHTSFPQGSNAVSGLLSLLERCTSEFRDTAHYKNDPRYLKLWLEYKDYSDSPRDIFIYLAKKEIGRLLALYYEQFAEYLEANGDWEDAKEIYEVGIGLEARPIKRLQRSFKNFSERARNSYGEVGSTRSRRGLSVRDSQSPHRSHGPQLHTPAQEQTPKRKFEIFNDNEEKDVLKSIFDSTASTSSIPQLGTKRLRTKENTMTAKPWAGEILKQKFVTTLPSSVTTKIPVYRDLPENSTPSSTDVDLPSFTVEKLPSGAVHSRIPIEGKKPERINIDLNELYREDEEFCLDEVIAEKKLKERRNQHTSSHSIIIPLKNEEDDSTLPSRQRPSSPTLTMFSRMANNEVLNMFNDAAQTINDEGEEEEEGFKTDNETTNYDGFVTETINLKDDHQQEKQQQREQTPHHESRRKVENSTLLESQSTPPTDQYDTTHSSPFIERPSIESTSNQFATYDPSDDVLREALLKKSNHQNTALYDVSSLKIGNAKKFSNLTHPSTKIIQKGSSEAIINYCGENHFCLRYELGKGGYGTVYLVETEMGELKALKIESPATKWEYYMLNQIHRRFFLSNYDKSIQSMVVKPESLYLFKDESYLIMDYISQGTVLDVVNYYKNNNQPFDETVAIWFSVELLKIIEILHDIDIIHGDLKADNCMVRIPQHDSTENGGITLIDFGRGIDLTLFGKNSKPRFISNWKSDQQDCPQMNNGETWSFEADYYGVASVIHTMLFGNYIEVQQVGQRILLKNSLKRYWQTQLWEPLFELLLNPGPAEDLPISRKLGEQRRVLEHWLQENGRSRGFSEKMSAIESDFTHSSKKLLRSLQ